MGATEFKVVLAKAYTNLNYDEFCKIIDEPTHYSDEYNYYALEKWNAFQIMCQNLAKLGTHFDKIIEHTINKH